MIELRLPGALPRFTADSTNRRLILLDVTWVMRRDRELA